MLKSNRLARPIGAWRLLGLLLLAVTLAVFGAAVARGHEENPVDAYLFSRTGCPFCATARSYLDGLTREIPDLRVRDLEVSGSELNRSAFIAVSRAMGVEHPVVPIVVVGDQVFVGYLDDSTTGAAIREAVLACRERSCADPLATFLESPPSAHAQAAPAEVGARAPGPVGGPVAGPVRGPVQAPSIPSSLSLPLLGEINTTALPLPLLTVVLGAVDGFNPCAMWVLVFLISLLLGMGDHRRMWILGGVFLLASAAVYFLFMAAWLNILLLLGALLWVRIAVGVFALGGGIFYLREFMLSGEAVCKVTRPDKRQRIMQSFRNAVHQRRLLLALGGIVVLAVAVNLIELLCSAGIPAVYTQVLSLTDLPAWQYYLYLLLYILVFLLDDLFVFATAMVTLQATGLTAKYSRYSHLLGGIVLCGVGALLVLRPEWLTFA